MRIEARPVLFVFSISLSALWACWYIKTSRGIFPKIVLLHGPHWPLKKNKSRAGFDRFLISLITRIPKKPSLIQAFKINPNDESGLTSTLLNSTEIHQVAENTVSTINGSAFIRFFQEEMESTKRDAACAYAAGLKSWPKNDRAVIHEAFVFNGRWAPVYMFLKGLQESARLRNLNYLEVIDAPTGKRIFETQEHPWELATFFNLAKKAQMERGGLSATDFFESRRHGFDKDGAKFVTQQKRSYDRAVDVVLYTSSLEEQIGFNYSARDAVNLSKRALRELAWLQRSGHQCVLRLHPNTANKHQRDRKVWNDWSRRLQKIGVKVIGADSEVSSYDLMSRAKTILTIGSTIGAESSYAGKVAFDFLDNSLPTLFGCTHPYRREDCLAHLKGAATFTHPGKEAYDLFGYVHRDLGVALPKWLILKK